MVLEVGITQLAVGHTVTPGAHHVEGRLVVCVYSVCVRVRVRVCVCACVR